MCFVIASAIVDRLSRRAIRSRHPEPWTMRQPFRTIRHSASPAARPMIVTMPEPMAADVVARYHKALARRDFDVARSLLKDDLRFVGPFDEFDAADDYLQALQRLFRIVDSVDVKHRSVAGSEVVVLFEMAPASPAGTQLVCEWFGVEGIRISSIRALFDTAPFAFLRQ